MTQPVLDESAIRETAYLLWLDEGQPHGCDEAHWLKAIDMLTPTKPVKKKAPAKAKTTKAKAAKAPAKAKTAAAKKPRTKAAAK